MVPSSNSFSEQPEITVTSQKKTTKQKHTYIKRTTLNKQVPAAGLGRRVSRLS